MVLLALAATRAAAQDGDFDDAGAPERLRALDDTGASDGDPDDAPTILDGANDDSRLSRSRSTDALDDRARSRSWRAGANAGATGADDISTSRAALARMWIKDASLSDDTSTSRPRRSPAQFLAALPSGAPPTPSFASIDEPGDMVIDSAPPLSAVVAATLRTGGLADDPVPGWRTRSRWSALVPAITSRVGNSESWREVTDPTVSRALSYDLRVSWRLDRLIYDPNEPRFAAFDISRRRERRRLIAIATHAYVEWLHSRAAELATANANAEGGDESSHGSGAARAARRAAALIEAHLARAELDALTNGWFSHALDKPTRSR